MRGVPSALRCKFRRQGVNSTPGRFHVRKTSMWICVGALSLFVSACSRNSSPASPSAPSGSPSSSAPAPALSGATIVVGTRTPTTVNIQNARIHSDATPLTCAQVQVNDRVEVHGTRNGTTLIATEVRIDTDHGAQRQPDHDDGDEGNKEEDEVKGVVAGAPAGHACPAFTFTVGTKTVTTTASTKFEHAMCAEVVNGMTVEAEGTKTGANALTATKVEIEDRSGRKH